MNILSNWKTYQKFLSRNKGYTAIDLFGLSISLAFVLLIVLYSWQEFSTDQFQENKENIYLVGSEGSACTAYAIPYQMKDRYPEIQRVCPVDYTGRMAVKCENNVFNASIMFSDSAFFKTFSFSILEGETGDILTTSGQAIVSQSFARKVFGTEKAVGRSFTIADTLHYLVGAVMEDFKHSCLPETDIMLPYKEVPTFDFTTRDGGMHNSSAVTLFVQTYPNAPDFRLRAGDILTWFKDSFWIFQNGINKEVRIEKLTDYYFAGWGNDFLSRGDRQFVLILFSVGILILIFAILNYINLTVAQAGFRAKEMATRRLLGSSRSELFWRLVLESIFMCTISMLIAIFLAFSIAPYASDLLQRQFDMSLIYSTPAWIFGIILFILLVGGISGWLPAIVISNAKPIEIVRGTLRVKTKMTYSKVFITFQNLITITMLTCSFVMILQLRHLFHAPLGYETKKLFVVEAPDLDGNGIYALVDAINGIGGVNRCGMAQQIPFYSFYNKTTTYKDGGIEKPIGFQRYMMERICFEMLGLKIVQDNHLANPKFYVNEKALRQMNLPLDAKSMNLEEEEVPISGVIADYCEGNIMQGVRPVLLSFLKRENDDAGWLILCEITGDPIQTVDAIQTEYKKLSGGLPLQGKFLDKKLKDSFQSQIRLTKIIGIFTFIAILISLLGLLAMSTYFIQQRSLEVAIRKVFGSDNQLILLRLIRSFLLYVGVAFVIAVPIAYYFMSDWLADYSYRITLSPLIFIVAGFTCFLISFCTVFIQSWRAANMNPTQTMKSL